MVGDLVDCDYILLALRILRITMGLRHSKVKGTPALLPTPTATTATATATAKPQGSRNKGTRKDETSRPSIYKTSGNTAAGKTGSAQKNKGPAAAGGLGGPPPGNEGQREAVITQENTGSSSPPLSPASTQSEASLPGLSQECDTASGDDTTPTTTTTSTPCVTCVSELPSSTSEAPHTQSGTHHHSLGNSASESVSQSVTQNGFEKDSEYESAEELDSPHHSSPEEAPQAPSTFVLPEVEGVAREEFTEGDSVHPPLECISDGQTESALPSSVVNASLGSDQTVSCFVNGVENDAAENVSVIPDTTTTTTTAPVSVTDTALVTNGGSEPPISTVCESVVTLTKNEVVEESIVENTILVDQQVIAATHPTPETDKPVDVSDINLDLVTAGDDSNTESCEPLVCVSANVSEAKETSDKAIPSGESECVYVPPTDQIREETCVSEATQETSRPEDTPQPPAEESTPILQELENQIQEKQEDTPQPLQQESTSVPHQETEHSLQEKQEASQDTTDSPVAHITEPHTTPEETSTERKEESPPLIPPPDPDDIPIAPKKGYNLDFLDYLDDPNFNPFASNTAIRNTPPPSPEPGVKLPPLKPAIKKKNKKAAQAAANQAQGGSESNVLETNVEHLSSVGKPSDSSQPSQDFSKVPDTKEETDQKENSSVLEVSLDDSDAPKTPAKPLRKPPQRRPLRKPQPKPEVTEKNNNRVEKEDENTAPKEEEDLPIPPSKGYNLDFLDNLDDPNFNPFASKTAVRNSPTEGAAFPASQSSPEKAEEPKPKVTVARKTSPKKGFTVPRKDSEVKSDSPQPNEDSVSQADKKEPIEVPEPCKPEPSPVEVPKEENEEELPLPKKGYNLDFLDDPNFDPFQTRSSVGGKVQSSAKSGGDKDAASAVIEDVSAKVVSNKDEPETVVNRAEVPCKETVPEHSKPEPSEICVNKVSAEPDSQGVADSVPVCTEGIPEPKNQLDENPESCITKDVNQTNQIANQNQESSPLPDSENNWSTEETESTEPHLARFKTPSIGTIGQLDSLEFDQLLEHEASRLAEEFMNCSRDSGLADYDESSDNHYSTMADTSYSNLRHVDENINPFQKSSQLARSPPLGKRGAVCGAEADPLGLPFSSRRSLKRDIVMGEERLDTSSLEDDSGIVLGSRSDLETEVNHSEAGPEIATGLTSSDLRCASQSNSDDLEEEFYDQITDEEFLSSETFFKEATDLENHLRRNLVSPLLGSHSKLSGDVTPTKDKKEPPAGAPESPQNKPTPSTSSPAPPPREERSAPEGTSSPSPRPSDTAERKSLSTRPTSAPPEGYMTASEVQELLKRQELKFEEKLLRVELAAGEKEKKLQQTMKDEQKEMATLGSSVAELTQSRDALLKMVSQYKGMLATLVTEKEKEKKMSDEKISALQGERDQALEDLANVEVAFSDVHRKYERTKQVVDSLKRNEETLRGAVADYEGKLKKQEQKFLEFQKHAEEKIQMANEEFENMRKSNEQEMTKMAALLKKAEMKIMSLQDSFDRKTRENQELTQLCDDLINKVGTSH